MAKMSAQRTWIIIGAAVIILVLVIAIVHYDRANPISQNNSGQNDAPTSTAAIGVALSSTGENSVAMPTLSSGSSVASSATSESFITIHLLTPIANNAWTIGQPNPIAWDTAAGITGEIDLVDATTKQFIGVIDSDVGVLQTSDIWDARTIALARYSPDSKNVVPGVYSIRIHFDGNNLGDLVSGPITISN